MKIFYEEYPVSLLLINGRLVTKLHQKPLHRHHQKSTAVWCSTRRKQLDLRTRQGNNTKKRVQSVRGNSSEGNVAGKGSIGSIGGLGGIAGLGGIGGIGVL